MSTDDHPCADAPSNRRNGFYSDKGKDEELMDKKGVEHADSHYR